MATTTGKPATTPHLKSNRADTPDTAKSAHGDEAQTQAQTQTPTTDDKGHHFDPIAEATPSGSDDASSDAPVKPIDKPVEGPVSNPNAPQILPNEDQAPDSPIRPTVDDGTASEGHGAEDVTPADQTPDSPIHGDRPDPANSSPSAVQRVNPNANPHEDR